MKSILPLLFLLCFSKLSAKNLETDNCTYYLSTEGSDRNSGKSIKDPFQTLEKARDTIRENISPKDEVVVCLRGGIYKRTKSFSLTQLDSGTKMQPIVYKAYKNENVRIIGAEILNNQWFKHDSKKEGNIYSVNLKKHGITNFGKLKERGFQKTNTSALELFANHQPMTLARWPDKNQNETMKQNEQNETIILFGKTEANAEGTYKKYKMNDGVNSYKKEGLSNGLQYYLFRYTWKHQNVPYTAWFVSTEYNKYPTKTNPYFSYYKAKLDNFTAGNLRIKKPEAINHGYAIIKEVSNGEKTFTTYNDERVTRWEKAKDLWFHGYWNRDWADLHIEGKVHKNAITLKHTPKFGLGKHKYFYVENLLEELTQAGEWYLDRDTGILYFWPIGELKNQEIAISLLEEPLVTLDNTSYVTFKNITFEMSRAELFNIKGKYNSISDSTVRNAGTTAIILNGHFNVIKNCNIYNTGNSALQIYGNKHDIEHLVKSNNMIVNNDIHHTSQWATTFFSAIKIEKSVGNIIKHNEIHDMPYSAIWFQGNEHLIEYNNIYSTNQFNSDGGAIYSGRSWGDRGNVIQYNFIHDLKTHFDGYGLHAVYLDDIASGMKVYKNIFYNIENYAVFTGGGRDNIIERNFLVNTSGFHTDCRGTTAIDHKKGSSWNFLEKLNQHNVDYRRGKWRIKYPLLAKIPNNWKQLNSEMFPDYFYRNKERYARWLYPEGTKLLGNQGYNNREWIYDGCASVSYLKSFKEVRKNNKNSKLLNDIDINLEPDSKLFSIDSNFKKIGRLTD